MWCLPLGGNAYTIWQCFKSFEIGNFEVEYINAGHLLGAAQIIVREGNETMLYTGDFCPEDLYTINGAELPMDEIDALFEESYTLEVSSPGPNRPLRSINDFVRYEGRNVKIIAKNIIDDGKKVFVGSIVSISETIISINDSGKVYAINFDEIEKANLRL